MFGKIRKFGYLLRSDQASDWRDVALLSGVGVWVLHRGSKELWQDVSVAPGSWRKWRSEGQDHITQILRIHNSKRNRQIEWANRERKRS